MPTTPLMYFNHLVLEDYQEFRNRPDDIRKGFHSSVSAFQMADIFYAYSKRYEPDKIAAWPAKKEFLIHLSQVEPLFLTVQSVATVYKHLYSASTFLNTASPQSIGGVMTKSNVDIESDWRKSTGGVVIIHHKDGSEEALGDALEAVVERMWPTYVV